MKVKKEPHVTGKTGAQRSDTKGKGRYDCILLGFPHMLFRLARLFEQGIESGYAPGNWKKGTDLRRWLEGGVRHISQFAEGLTNEDHLIAGIWNLLCLGETRHLIETGILPTELDNLPFTPKPGDRRINPETGALETWMKMVAPDPGGIDPSKPVQHETIIVDPGSLEEGDEIIRIPGCSRPGCCEPDPCSECLDKALGPKQKVKPSDVALFIAEAIIENREPPLPSIRELQTRVDEGELLSDRENARLQAASNSIESPPPFSVEEKIHQGMLPDDSDVSCTIPPSELLPPFAVKDAKLYLDPPNAPPESIVELPTFYVCGPMTGIKDFNFPLFDQVTALARSQGLSVISPAELDREHGIDPSVDPDSVERARRADPNLIQTIVQRDTQVIVGLEKDKGDGLILLPGWQNSTGGRAEIALALWMGLSFKGVITTWHGQKCELTIEEVHPGWVMAHLFYQEKG